MGVTEAHATVVAVEECRLLLADEGWEFAEAHAHDIEAHWERRLEDNPEFFNGTIYLTRGATVEDGVLSARVFATDFKNFLYWRETGYGDRSVTDVFGSALIVSADGAVHSRSPARGAYQLRACLLPRRARGHPRRSRAMGRSTFSAASAGSLARKPG